MNTEIINQLQQEKKAAEDMKKQLEEKNREKGDIILDGVEGFGSYICLRNISSEDKMMTGWKLKLQINDTEFTIYEFQENLKAGEKLTLRGEGAMWNSGDNVKISLISSTGEEHRLM